MDTLSQIEISEINSLPELIEALGFVETKQMRSETNPVDYDNLGKEAGLLKNPEGQIALLLKKALRHQANGNQKRFLEEIHDAKRYSEQMSHSYPERFNGIAELILRLTIA